MTIGTAKPTDEERKEAVHFDTGQRNWHQERRPEENFREVLQSAHRQSA